MDSTFQQTSRSRHTLEAGRSTHRRWGYGTARCQQRLDLWPLPAARRRRERLSIVPYATRDDHPRVHPHDGSLTVEQSESGAETADGCGRGRTRILRGNSSSVACRSMDNCRDRSRNRTLPRNQLVYTVQGPEVEAPLDRAGRSQVRLRKEPEGSPSLN